MSRQARDIHGLMQRSRDIRQAQEAGDTARAETLRQEQLSALKRPRRWKGPIARLIAAFARLPH